MAANAGPGPRGPEGDGRASRDGRGGGPQGAGPGSRAPEEGLPRVSVLMATYNGASHGGRWLREQVESILGQRGVDVRLVVSDDGSTDSTVDLLTRWSASDPRIRLLPRRQGEPGVAGNFLHLFTAHDPDGSFVAFSDQDDVWHLDKLSSQLELMGSRGADVVSSNVMAFRCDRDGSVRDRHLIRKSGPQRRWDYIFEAAGPGSTYVFSPDAHRRLVGALARLDPTGVDVHDWYLYALARALGATWVIGEEPTLEYRQHDSNVQGANSGAGATRARMEKLRSGFYRRQFILVAQACLSVGSYDARERRALESLAANLRSTSVWSRIAFALRFARIRRQLTEGIKLAGARVLGVW